jgi:hypothetical protein
MERIELQNILYTIFLRSPINLFDEFICECQKWYEVPAHSFVEIRKRDNKKIRGDIFEEFCVLYLKYIKGYNNVMLLKEVPSELLEKLSIKRRDMGIDIIVEHNNNYYAVQCKYKKNKTKRKNIVSWKALSTFYALCLRSGPWTKYIIMTNCDYAKHEGAKSEKDLSLCLKTFQNIDKDNWLKMCNLNENILNNIENIISENISDISNTALTNIGIINIEEKIAKPSIEELRKIRLEKYSTNQIST